jgi:hypothetical protein
MFAWYGTPGILTECGCAIALQQQILPTNIVPDGVSLLRLIYRKEFGTHHS